MLKSEQRECHVERPSISFTRQFNQFGHYQLSTKTIISSVPNTNQDKRCKRNTSHFSLSAFRKSMDFFSSLTFASALESMACSQQQNSALLQPYNIKSAEIYLNLDQWQVMLLSLPWLICFLPSPIIVRHFFLSFIPSKLKVNITTFYIL